MDDDFGPRNEAQKIRGNDFKFRFISQKLIADSVHFQRVFVAVSLRIQVMVKMIASDFSAQQFHSTDFDDPIAIFSRKARGFCV